VSYHSIWLHPGHLNMVLRQHNQVVWPTKIVFKLLRLWLQHTLLLLIITQLPSFNIILHLHLHLRLRLVFWFRMVPLSHTLAISTSTTCPSPATPTPGHSTLCPQPIKTLSSNISMHLFSITPGALNWFHTCNMHKRVTPINRKYTKQKKKNTTVIVWILKFELQQSTLDFKIWTCSVLRRRKNKQIAFHVEGIRLNLHFVV